APRVHREPASLRALLGAREGDQLLEPRGGRAGVERLACDLETFAQIGCVAARGDRPGGVEQDRAPATAVAAGEYVADRLRILLRSAAAELLDGGVRDAEPALGIDVPLVHLSV